MIDHKSGNSDWEGGGCNTTHLFRRISAFPLIRRQLRTLNSVEIVFFTSWPCRMALSVASFLISRMAESVQPPRFSTAIGPSIDPTLHITLALMPRTLLNVVWVVFILADRWLYAKILKVKDIWCIIIHLPLSLPLVFHYMCRIIHIILESFVHHIFVRPLLIG